VPKAFSDIVVSNTSLSSSTFTAVPWFAYSGVIYYYSQSQSRFIGSDPISGNVLYKSDEIIYTTPEYQSQQLLYDPSP